MVDTQTLHVGNQTLSYYNIADACQSHGKNVEDLPYTLRILLESLLRKGSGSAEEDGKGV